MHVEQDVDPLVAEPVAEARVADEPRVADVESELARGPGDARRARRLSGRVREDRENPMPPVDDPAEGLQPGGLLAREGDAQARHGRLTTRGA